MPSDALEEWRGPRAAALDEVAAAHAAVGGRRRGRRYVTLQINHAYSLLLAAQFQGFCRDLHTECINHLIRSSPIPPLLARVLRDEFFRGRQLDRGNAQPASLGADYGRLGLEFWDGLRVSNPASVQWRGELESLNEWRNAIAHQDFSSPRLGPGTLRLARVRRWRRACNRLARLMDQALRAHLHGITGVTHWA